jgi:hypothetical protein
MYIYLDETGYTGRNIMNPDQPVHVLASTSMSAGDAAELKRHFFAGVQSRELKHSTLSSRGRGQSQIAAFMAELTNRPTVAATLAYKPYALLALLVDFWVEPAMRRDGYNLNERGGNIALTNTLWYCLGACQGLDGFFALLRDAEAMLVSRDRSAYDRFWTALGQIADSHPRFEELFDFLGLSNIRLGGYPHLLSVPERLTDLGTFGVLESVMHWRGTSDESLVLRPDRSSAFSRERAFWDAILSPDVPPALVGQDRRTIRFPLNVGDIEFSESHQHDQLQLVDLVAGAVATYYRHFIGGEAGYKPEYAAKLKDVGIGALVINSLWPAMANTPEALGTDGPVYGDAADFMAAQIRDRQ